MAEGGILRWKTQKLNVKPTLSTKDILNPLPNPPEGYEWKVDDASRTWSIQRISSDSNEFENQGVKNLKPVQPPYFSDVKPDVPPPAYDDYVKQKYLEHVIMPTDTLQGICLRYKITAVKLRQVNQFSGSSLLLAPPKLYIPITDAALESGAVRIQDRTSKDFKMLSFMAELRGLNMSIGKKEADFYLNLHDWDVDAALREARDDYGWEQDAKELSSMQLHTGVVVNEIESNKESIPLIKSPKIHVEMASR